MRTRALLISLALSATLLHGQSQPAPAQSPAPAPAPAVEATAPAQPEVKIKDEAPVAKAKEAGHDTISVDFPDEDIRTILRSVADLFELNLVVPDSLQGKTSVKLRDVSWRQIFHVVLAPVNYTYLEEGNIIKIVSNESLQQEPTTTEVFILNYARAADIMPTVASLVEAAAGGKIVVDARSNSLVITERPSRLNRVRPIIDSLDRATDQVMIESKFIEVTDGDVRNLGVKWASMDGITLGASNLNKNFQQNRNQGSSDGSNGSTTNGSSSTSSTSSNNSASNSAGSNVIVSNGAVNSNSNTSANATLANGVTNSGASNSSDLLNQLTSLTHGGTMATTATAVFSASDFSTVLSALSTISNTKIVSNPTIVTLNNSEASINVGEEYPIPNYTYNQERGTFEVSGFTYRPIGIILKVTPQVNARGFVKLSIEPEVSQRNGETNFGGAGGAAIPIIATRKAKTQVSLKDGYTMGIGGLLRKQDTSKVTKVPLLGDIPFLGNLFKHKANDNSATNLLIFITAKVVSAEGATLDQVIDPRQVRMMNLNKGDLPGQRGAANPFPDEPVAPVKPSKSSK
jgi:type IV pilus assembly protein PilQ